MILKRTGLKLVAPKRVREAADALFEGAIKDQERDSRSPVFIENNKAFRELERQFVEAARQDLGYRT